MGHLESNLLHFTCDSLSEHLKTMDRYTTLAAQELAARRVRVPLWQHDLSIRRGRLCKTYVLQRGFLDGAGRTDHRLHGGVLHVPEVLQSEKHELMRMDPAPRRGP